MALHRSSKFNAADGLFETEKPAIEIKKETQKVEKKAEAPAGEKKTEEASGLTQETTNESTETMPENKGVEADNALSSASQKSDELKDVSPKSADIQITPAKETVEAPVAPEKSRRKLSATAIMPRKAPKKASESVINRTYTIDQGTYDLMSALVRFMRDSKVKDEETGYLINESSFIRRAIRTEMDRVFDSNDEAFSDSVRKYLDKPLKSSPARITY
ncbi:MAG: hypothetical protein ILP08_06350 [Lachnospiraceae bacterium]|nr:hypothetical protein [Lachnospiraceae bacterium]